MGKINNIVKLHKDYAACDLCWKGRPVLELNKSFKYLRSLTCGINDDDKCKKYPRNVTHILRKGKLISNPLKDGDHHLIDHVVNGVCYKCTYTVSLLNIAFHFSGAIGSIKGDNICGC